MKKLLYLLILFIPIKLKSQGQSEIKIIYNKLPVSGEVIRYLDTVGVPGLTKDEIYSAVKKWTALNYRSANDVIQLDNREGGEIVVKGIMSSGFHLLYNPFDCFHTLLVGFKDGKYRIDLTIYEITTTSTHIDPHPPVYYYKRLSKRNAEKLFLSIDKAVRKALQSLNDAINDKKSNSW